MLGEGELLAPSPRDFARRLLTWHREGFPELGDSGGRGMGRSTARVLDDPDFLVAPQACARRAWDALGRCAAPNGALMRAAVCGLAAEADAAALAQATHADPRSTAACVAVATLVALMLEATGMDMESLLSRACAAGERHLVEEDALGRRAGRCGSRYAAPFGVL